MSRYISNGTMGDMWMRNWCNRCAVDHAMHTDDGDPAMTDARTVNRDATANVVALVNAQHHHLDAQAAHAYNTMTPEETRHTLIAAINELAEAWAVDATEQGMTWDDYIAGVARGATP